MEKINRIIIETTDSSLADQNFNLNEIKKVNFKNGSDYISSSIPIGTVSFEINLFDSSKTYYYSKNQIVRFLREDNTAIFVSFVKDVKKIGEKAWRFETEDYISVLEDVPYRGKFFDGTTTYGDAISELFGIADVPFMLFGDFDETINGHITHTNCRDALSQICFSCGAVVSTEFYGSGVANPCVIVKKINIDDWKRNINLNEIHTMKSNKKIETTKQVCLAIHSYEKDDSVEETIIFDGYENNTSGRKRIELNSPCFDFRITGGGEIYIQEPCYIEFHSVANSTKVYAKKYKHEYYYKIRAKDYETVSSVPIGIVIDGCELITEEKSESVLERCFDYVNAEKVEIKFSSSFYQEPFIFGYYAYGFGKRRYGSTIQNRSKLRSSEIVSIPVWGEEKNGFIERITQNSNSDNPSVNCTIMVI